MLPNDNQSPNVTKKTSKFIFSQNLGLGGRGGETKILPQIIPLLFSFWRNFATKIKTLICTSVFFFPSSFVAIFTFFLNRIYTENFEKFHFFFWKKLSWSGENSQGKKIHWSELYPFSEQFWKGQTCASLIRFEPTICAEEIGREFEPVS